MTRFKTAAAANQNKEKKKNIYNAVLFSDNELKSGEVVAKSYSKLHYESYNLCSLLAQSTALTVAVDKVLSVGKIS